MAVILLHQHVTGAAGFRLLKYPVEIDVAFPDNSHGTAVGIILQMNAGNAAGQPFKPLGRIAAAGLNPEGVQGEAHLLRGNRLHQALDDQSAVQLSELLIDCDT